MVSQSRSFILASHDSEMTSLKPPEASSTEELSTRLLMTAEMLTTLKDCSDVLKEFLEEAYPLESRTRYSSQARAYEIEMEPVRRVRKLLDRLAGDD